MGELLNIAAIAFGFPVLIWAGWFGWNMGLAAAGSKTTDRWRQLP